MTKLSPMMSRLAAIALLLAVAATAVVLIVLPAVDYFLGLRAQVTAERETLGRFEAFAANKDVAKTLAERSGAAMESGLFITGATDTLRTANLQSFITEVAQTHGVRLSSMRALPAQEADGLRFVGVQAEMDSDLKQLQAMIKAFESRRPFVFIQSLQVVPAPNRRPDLDELKVRFGLVGAVAPGEDTKS
jgi:Type II secretion system (T2SS), protein M subtype b